MFHNDGFHVLDRQECLRRMAKVQVGRVVYTRRALPAVLPVNFSLDTDSAVLLHTSARSELVRAIDGVVVAFEADDFDPETCGGWSVTVLGEARAVADPAEAERLSRLPLPTWAPGPRETYIRIAGRYVSGRRINTVPV